jgi:hypothetical protein
LVALTLIHFFGTNVVIFKRNFFQIFFVKENREYIGIYWHKVIAPCQSWVTHESFQFMQSSVGQLRGRLGKSSSNNGLHNIFYLLSITYWFGLIILHRIQLLEKSIQNKMIVFLSVKYNDSPKQLNFSKILPYIV